MMRTQKSPGVPTMPEGNEVAVYSTYLKAQKAVDSLSDSGFPVQGVTIVGHDLHMVERVLGRLTYPRIALAGFASGAWFGLFVGLLLSLFGDGSSTMITTALLVGGAFGLLFSVLSYALTRGKRDFTSSSQIVAARYVLLCVPQSATEARALLQKNGVAGDWTPSSSNYMSAVVGQNAAATTPAPTGPVRTYGQAIDHAKTGAQPVVPTTPVAPARPQYGAMAPQETPIDSAEPEVVPEAPTPRELENPDNPFSPPKDS